MPDTVFKLRVAVGDTVKEGDQVRQGDLLVVLEYQASASGALLKRKAMVRGKGGNFGLNRIEAQVFVH